MSLTSDVKTAKKKSCPVEQIIESEEKTNCSRSNKLNSVMEDLYRRSSTEQKKTFKAMLQTHSNIFAFNYKDLEKLMSLNKN